MTPGFLSVMQAESGVVLAHAGHERMPPGFLGMIVLALAVATVVLVFGLCARYFLVPGETSPTHIKRRILE